MQAPEEYLARYRGKLPTERLEGFCAAVTCMDAAIGEVLKWLEERGQAERTLILFLSDNGGSGNGGNAPLRGGKGQMWEGGLRVPFVARWPGRLPAGRVSDEFLSSLEIFPTLLAAAEVEPPAGVALDGFDMLPVLRGEQPSPRTEMFWQRRAQQAARAGHWKWVGGAGGGLFDLSHDLGERQDLSAAQPQVLQDLQARFGAWQRALESAEPRGPFRDY